MFGPFAYICMSITCPRVECVCGKMAVEQQFFMKNRSRTLGWRILCRHMASERRFGGRNGTYFHVFAERVNEFQRTDGIFSDYILNYFSC